MIQKNDFVEIEYVGRIKDTEKIFDLTDVELAKAEGIYQPNAHYGPVTACVGHKDVVAGVDESLVGKKAGEEYDVEVLPEKGFGKKRAELIRLVPLEIFTAKGIKPIPGVQFSFDGIIGIVRSASGGRILVDFNHPLSGKVLKYHIKIVGKIEDTKEKLEKFLKDILWEPKIEVKNGHAIITADIRKGADKKLSEEIKKRIPSLKLVEFKPIAARKIEQATQQISDKKITASQK
jgi:FKBP-type peptidyl-prolyl cis-trans isomerase 2